MKTQRQARILELIARYDVKTQDEITAMLREEGFKVTQATVSRDLRDLKLTKNMSDSGKYRYGTHTVYTHDTLKNAHLNAAMIGSIIGIRYSMNNVVVKTLPGLAQAVASGIDSMALESVLGCVAGDDTIIVITTDEKSSAQICDKIKRFRKDV